MERLSNEVDAAVESWVPDAEKKWTFENDKDINDGW